MRIPISHCLAFPDRILTDSPRLDLTRAATLEFAAPDHERFEALTLARAALVAGHGAPTVLNAANEIAVAAFLNHEIGFLDIAYLVAATLEKLGAPKTDTLQEVLEIDRKARQVTLQLAAAKAASRAA